jgi:hypothetical protein
MKNFHIAMLAVVMAACAGSSSSTTTSATPQPVVAPKPAPLDPAGTYEFTTLVQGQTVTGTLTIAAAPTGGYTGRVVTNMFPEIPITAASVEENKIVIAKGSMPDGELTIRMVMDGMNFTGTWALGADSGDFNGKKLPR